MINPNITKHELIANYLKENLTKNKFNEDEEELRDINGIQPALDQVERESSYEIEKVAEQQEDNIDNDPNLKDYESSETEISEDLSQDDEEEIEVNKYQHTTIKDSIRKQLKLEPKMDHIPKLESIEETKASGVITEISEAKVAERIIEIPGLESSENDTFNENKSIKKRVIIGKGQKAMTDFYKKI